MQCSCDIDIDVDNIEIRFLTQQDVIAITYYICDECNRVIKQDEAYELVYGDWGSGAETYHTCSDCLNLRNIFFPCSFFFGRIWEDFNENLNDWGYQIPEDCMIKLSKRNFNKICNKIEEGWEHLESIGR